MQHTKACEDRQKACADFRSKWPNFCTTCGGAGSWYSPGNYHNPPDGGPCGCVEDGKCPMCASEIVFEEQGPCEYGKCNACGWDEFAIIEGKQPAEIYPDVDCYCEEYYP